jgi:hypothetical protein
MRDSDQFRELIDDLAATLDMEAGLSEILHPPQHCECGHLRSSHRPSCFMCPPPRQPMPDVRTVPRASRRGGLAVRCPGDPR